MTRNPLGPIIAVLVLLAALVPAATPAADAVSELTVVGVGEAAAPPDMAQIEAGVISEGKTAAAALGANNTAMTALFDTLSRHAIGDTNIQTTAFNVFPVYSRENAGADVTGYRVENRINVKVHELARLGAVLDTLVAQGANMINSIRFGVAQPQTLLDQARNAAVADAKRKAELYAKAASLALGPILSLHEEGAALPGPQPPFARTMQMAEAVPIASGESNVTVRIVIAYEIVAR